MTKLKLYAAGLATFVYLFSQQFWLSDAFIDKGVEQVITPSPLANLVMLEKQTFPKSDIFGVAIADVVENNGNDSQELTKVFEGAANEFIGQLLNYQYLLYATAQYSGSFSAKLLIKNLDNDEISVQTVKVGDKVKVAQVSNIKLSEITLTASPEQIKLNLFSKVKPPLEVNKLGEQE